MRDDKGERRGHFRGKPRPGRRVRVRYQLFAGGEELVAYTKNIGVGGAFIVTPRPPKIGTHMRLVIDMPLGGQPIEVRAEVRWISPPEPEGDGGAGVRFTGLDVDQLLTLNEYFASLTATVEHD